MEHLGVQVLAAMPHDPAAFTQGLVWHAGELLESTGQYGASTLRRVDPETGEVRQRVTLEDELFGEGLARIGDRLIQLTWREEKALVWSLDAFEPLARFAYDGPGWGLCYDGRRLVMSDGSEFLTLRDPRTFAVQGRLRVTMDDRPLRNLNELECAEGWIFANVIPTEYIVRIDPTSGRVSALIDASGLLTAAERSGGVDVLNGIAHNPDRGTFYITGKYWPRMFEVVFTSEDAPAP